MTKEARVKIKPLDHPGRCEVYLDGEKMYGISGYDIHHEAHNLPEVCLTVIPERVSYENLAKVGLQVDVNCVYQAWGCISLEMRLDKEYRISVLSRIAKTLNDFPELSNEELAAKIMEELFEVGA